MQKICNKSVCNKLLSEILKRSQNIKSISYRSKFPNLKFYPQQRKGGLKNMHFSLADDVAKLGVTVSYTPNGVTRKDFNKVLAAFPAPGKIIK